MKLFLFLVLFLLAIILLPIYIKITLYFDNSTLKITIFNKTIDINTIRKMIKVNKEAVHAADDAKDSLGISSISAKDIRFLIKNLSNNKHKPKLNITGELKYGTEDAAITAILYGIIAQGKVAIELLLSTAVDVSFFSINVIPIYNTEIITGNMLFKLKINIFKIIYLVLIIKKSLKGEKNIYSSKKNL